MDTALLNEGDSAIMFYSGQPRQYGTVTAISKDGYGDVRRVGITPAGTDHVAWFYPVEDLYTMWNATNTVGAVIDN